MTLAPAGATTVIGAAGAPATFCICTCTGTGTGIEDDAAALIVRWTPTSTDANRWSDAP